MTEEEVIKRYGAIVNGKLVDEDIACKVIQIPISIYAHFKVTNTATQMPFTRLYGHCDLEAPFIKALTNVLDAGVQDELHTFDGCFNVRLIRGGLNWSAHSWGMAVDLNASLNPLGGISMWSDRFVQCFTMAGFTWGGTFQRRDPQHFSLVGF